jgi:hypothetical protein
LSIVIDAEQFSYERNSQTHFPAIFVDCGEGTIEDSSSETDGTIFTARLPQN